MAKDSANAAITVGANIKIVGTVAAITEPGNNNLNNIWIALANPVVKDNNGNTVGNNGICILINGSNATLGV